MSKREDVGHWISIASAPVLAAGLFLGLAACGEKTEAPASDTGAPAEEAPEDEASAELPEGQDLPSDWPSEILVPDGAITVLLEVGSGYALTLEGVDSVQAQGLIAEMATAGLKTEGPTDLGNDAWTASASNADYSATYAYENGGAGLPKVLINLTAL